MKRRTFLFTFLFVLPLNVMGMQNAPDLVEEPDELNQAAQVQVDRALGNVQPVLARLPEVMNGVPNIMQRMRDREEQKRLDTENALKNEYQVLWSYPLFVHHVPAREAITGAHWDLDYEDWIPKREVLAPERDIEYRVGLRKHDLVEGGVWAANVAADIALYKHIKKWRIERIKDYVMNNMDEVENVLTHIKTEINKIDTDLKNEKITQREADQQKTELGLFIAKFANMEHTLKSLLSEKRIFAGIAARLAVEKIGDVVQSSMTTDYWAPNFLRPNFVRNEAGELVKEQSPMTISVVSIARLLISPSQFLKSFFGNSNNLAASGLEFANRTLGLGIPELFFNKKFKMCSRFVVQVGCLLWSAKMFDGSVQQDWIKHLQEKHKELLTLVQEYKHIAEQPEGEGKSLKLKEIERHIEAFVVKGHKARSFFSWGTDYWRWSSLKQLPQTMISNYKFWALVGIVGFKAFQFYQQLRQPQAHVVAPQVD